MREWKLSEEEPFVEVARAENEAMALMLAELLENNGIKCLVKAMGPGVGGWASAAFLEHRLYVRASQAQEARDILGVDEE